MVLRGALAGAAGVCDSGLHCLLSQEAEVNVCYATSFVFSLRPLPMKYVPVVMTSQTCLGVVSSK